MTASGSTDQRGGTAAPGHIAVQIAWLEKQPGGQKGLAAGAGVTTKTLRNWKNGGMPRPAELQAVHDHAVAAVPGYPGGAGVPALVDDGPAATPSATPDRRRPALLLGGVAVVIVVLLTWALLRTTASDQPTGSVTPTSSYPAEVGQTANDANGSGTFRDHVNGVDPGPRIDPGTTIEVSCRAEGLLVGNGNPWWYRVGSAPWDGDWWAPADNFYNNGATSGPVADTPFVDETVPLC